MTTRRHLANFWYPKLLPLGPYQFLVRLLNQGDQEFLLNLFAGAPGDDLLILKENFHHPYMVDQWFARLDYRQVLPLAAVTAWGLVGEYVYAPVPISPFLLILPRGVYS